MQRKFYKLPKCSVNIDPIVSKIQSFENVKIYKDMHVWPSERCPTQRPDAIHFYVNFDVFKSLYLSQNWPD